MAGHGLVLVPEVDQAASPGWSPVLPAISLGHSRVWGGLSAEGHKKLSRNKTPV